MIEVRVIRRIKSLAMPGFFVVDSGLGPSRTNWEVSGEIGARLWPLEFPLKVLV